MCLYSVDGPEPKIAERDIECYKVVKVKAGKDGSKTYYPMRYPESPKAYAVVYPPTSLRGIEARAEGEHTWSRTERMLYRTMKSEYYEEDRLHCFEGGWIHGFLRLADAESAARQLLFYTEDEMKKEGMTLEIWKCVVRKGRAYHKGFAQYRLLDKKYMYCVCSESMIFDRMETVVDDWRSPSLFAPAIVDKSGAEWYRITRSDNTGEWRKDAGNGVVLGDGERMNVYAYMPEADYYDAYVCVTDGVKASIRIEYAGSCVDSFAPPQDVSCESLRIKKVEAPSREIAKGLFTKPYVAPKGGAARTAPSHTHAEWRLSKLDYWKPSQFGLVLNVSEKETVYVR